MMLTPHAVSSAEVLEHFGVSEHQGLMAQQVETIRQQSRWNELAGSQPRTTWLKVLDQFRDFVVQILIVAAVISGLLGEWTDALAIIAIVILNAILGYFQEERAEQSLAALQRLAAPTARVIRGGKIVVIPARELVPGDVVQIEAGDKVPADLRLVETSSVQIQEASLTGESLPVEKHAEGILPPDTPLAERRNMAFMDTNLSYGQGKGVVVATGMKTEIGRIAALLQNAPKNATPLQRQLATVGRILAACSLFLVGLIFCLGLWHGIPFYDSLLSSVSLAVAAVPEGLPAVVTTALALGLQRMVRRNALIRKLPSVETLGCVTVICSDKTGTLTRNEMTVRELSAGGFHFQITGSGYSPEGELFVAQDSELLKVDARHAHVLKTAFRIGAYCNHSNVQQDESDGNWKVIGDPTEGALIVLARKGDELTEQHVLKIVETLPFDSDRKVMSVLVEDEQGRRFQYTKGAPEAILSRCSTELKHESIVPLDDNQRQLIQNINEEMASRALRVLGLAFRPVENRREGISEKNLTFVGLAGMIDPPRDEAKQAVAKCREAGIQPVMITGDHPATATAIARELGIAGAQERAVSGEEIEKLSNQELAQRVPEISVYARVSPEHKLRIVEAWQSRNEVVAMTGDGVNDAPAVKAADIGISMGITGTDVTREASAMILMDDNFASIVSAVEEGRTIYDNIQKFLSFLLSCNAGELMLMLFASLMGWPVPLLPVHLLWINLVTDGLPALALAMEPPERGLMLRKPRQSTETILSWNLGLVCLGQGLLLAVAALVTFALFRGETSEQLQLARTMTFSVVVYGELFRSFAARSHKWTYFQMGAFTNLYLVIAVGVSAVLQLIIVSVPFFATVFQADTSIGAYWPQLALLSLIPVTVIEVSKLGYQLLTNARVPLRTTS